MGDRPARSTGENPDSPLVFSVPASLQEYMSRYVDRPGERTPPPPSAAAASPQPLPIRNWFDNRRPSNNPTATQPAPSPTPLRAAAAAYEYNATVAAPPAARLGVRDANPAAAETRASMHSDYIAAWRAMSGPPLLGPVAAEVEREGQQPSSRRRFQTAHGNENNGTESDGGGAGRRRSQARSASRGGRPQSSTDARRSSGGLGRDGTGGGHSSGGWRAEGGGGVADVPFSPMSAGGRNHVSGGWGGGGSVISDVPRHWHSTVSGNPANGSVWRSREFPPGHRAHESADEGNGTPRSGSAQRGRRSLSDFLREIEEIVRAQREQQNRDQENLSTRPQVSSRRHEGTRSRPLAAAAAAMAAPPPQEHPRGNNDGRASGGSTPHIGGNARYIPPGERRWPTITSHILRAGSDTRFLGNPAAVGAEGNPYSRHPAAGGRQEETSSSVSRSAASPGGVAEASPHPPHTRSNPSHYVIPTLATTAAAAAAGAMAGAGARPQVAGAPQASRPATASRATLHPPIRLSAAATAFSMPPAGETAASPDQPSENDTSTTARSGGGGGGNSSYDAAQEERARREGWSAVQAHAREAERRRGLAIGRDGLAVGREGRLHGGVLAAMAAAARNRGDQSVPAHSPNPNPNANPDGSWASTQAERLAQAGLGFAHGGRLQHGERGPYLEVVPLTRMAELPPERGSVVPGDGGAASTTGGGDGAAGGGARTADDQSQGRSQGHSQNFLGALPAFRHWESQRARLRIQWHDPNSPPQPVGADSPASDGTMVLTEHLSSSGPSPRGGSGFGRGAGVGGGGGSDEEEASEVEEALFSNLMGLGVRRLLLERRRGAPTTGRNRRTPVWLEEWLDGGARPNRAECSSAGPSGYENRCPRVGDVWELLELLLGWWAERICAVAGGFPMWSGQAAVAEGEAAAAVGVTGAAIGGGATGQQQRRGGGWGRQGGDGIGSLASVTTRAVESVQDLRKLGEFIMPLSRVRESIGIDGGPTPRDAVLLKSLLVAHEGIAWAADRPHYRHYREEVIPTALKLYASLPQDVLEGVDLEVGHTLPESVFALTGTARPSWPRWGGSPSVVTATTPTIEGERGNAPGSSGAGSHRPGRAGAGDDGGGGSGSGGMGIRDGRFISGSPFGGGGGDSGRAIGGGGGRGRFLPGPWVVFRVAREEYLKFYRAQATALDQAIGGSAVELEHMLM